MVRRKLALMTLLAGCFLGQPLIAQAGCGCDKPPPELAMVQPNATYAGRDVTLTHPSILNGQSYAVTFTSGMTGQSATVTRTAVFKRDLADGQAKAQVLVPVPALPLGPTSISVSLAGLSVAVLAVTDDAFTVAPPPIVFPETVGQVSLPDYQAAVSRSGVVYISLDVSDMHLPRTFHAQAVGYPIRFTNDEVVFYNTQGFLMQLLDEGMPGLFAIDAATGSPDSDTLQYSRHEFNTHFLQHAERQVHGVDASDPNWHLDGTPHIDHDHLIVAISGMLDDGSLPAPGATPAFELALNTATLFRHGIVGGFSVAMSGSSRVDSYHGVSGAYGTQGDVLTNGLVSLSSQATIAGDATALQFILSGNAQILGEQIVATGPVESLHVAMPSALENLGKISVKTNKTATIVGPGSFQVSEISVSSGGQLLIDNAAGPLTLYVTGKVSISGTGQISVADPDPEKFAIYALGNSPVKLSGGGTFYGVIHAPQALVSLSGEGQFFGAFIGSQVTLSGSSQVHYDPALRGE